MGRPAQKVAHILPGSGIFKFTVDRDVQLANGDQAMLH